MNSTKYKNDLYEVRKINNLKELINSSADMFSEKNAVMQKSKITKKFEPVTYKELKNDIDALGTKLIDLGLKNENIVIVSENSYQWIVSYFAIVNGTGVVVPIDRELKSVEIANLIKRAHATCIFCSKKAKGKIKEVMADSEIKGKIKYLIQMDADANEDEFLSFYKMIEDGREMLLGGDRNFIDAEIDNEKMSTLLFTSGTTGLAKGVMLSHRNISANVYNMSKYVKIKDGSVGLSVLPMHHTYEMTCHVMTALYQGMTLAICQGLKHIQENLSEIPANVMLAVPLIFEMMHKKIWKNAQNQGRDKKMRTMINLSNRFKLYNHPKLIKKIFAPIHEATGNGVNLFIAGGAAINPKVIEDYQAMGLPMIQGYGMTENAPIIAVNKDRYSKPQSVGLPMPETEVKIVDKDEEGIGEIICKGPSVMIGYYENEEATKETIRDGWLYTGDYGYIDEEGFLYVTGRKKSVIVTKNGKNIFPEEVEYYLTENEYVSEVLVHGVEAARNDDVIIQAEIYPNYQLIEEDFGVRTKEDIVELFQNVVDQVNEKMPNYKRIKRFNIREVEFEKTTTRKIKRHLKSNLNGGIRESE